MRWSLAAGQAQAFRRPPASTRRSAAYSISSTALIRDGRLFGPHGTRVAPLLRLAIRLRHGSRVGWHGVDVFHFNAAGKITGKYTYASYDRPRLSRTLGVPL